jgi:hypothetical protein
MQDSNYKKVENINKYLFSKFLNKSLIDEAQSGVEKYSAISIDGIYTSIYFVIIISVIKENTDIYYRNSQIYNSSVNHYLFQCSVHPSGRIRSNLSQSTDTKITLLPSAPKTQRGSY